MANFPLNQVKLDSSYISAVEDDTEGTILAQYVVFKKLSAALVKFIKRDIDTYGSLEQLPDDILKKYNRLFSELFENYKNLKEDLQRQVNKNTKDLEYIHERGDDDSFINRIVLRKRKKLHGKIEYFDNIFYLQVCIAEKIEPFA
jgi:hypothetical protein